MDACRVKTVLLPYRPGIRPEHTVSPDDKLSHAVKIMLSHGMKTIAVMRNGYPIGIIRLEDALEKLGL